MNEPEKVDLESMDIAERKRRQLERIFPEAFAEGKIDFEQLKRVLGEWVEPGKERFGLNWHGKAECVKIMQERSPAALKPNREQSLRFDDTQNLFIEGDNLEVLKILQESYYGAVKMIYIDPPYNTGGDFIYPDKYSETLQTYLSYTGQADGEGKKFDSNTEINGRRSSLWLKMMYPRLCLARDLLREDGVIFINIDDHEHAKLRLMCDEIFGPENFVENIIWRKKSGGGQQDDYIVTEHDYILCYGRHKGSLIFPQIVAPPKTKGYNLFDDKKKRNYKLVKLAKWGSQALREDRITMYDYPELIAPDGKQVFPVSPDGRPGRWRIGRKLVVEMLENDDIEWKEKDGDWMPYEKEYEPSENEGAILKERSIFYDVAENTSGSNELTALFGIKDVFHNPKPSDLIAKLVHLVSKPEDGDIILDFFAGSCSTAHAVMSLNDIDGGNRSFINIQLPEKLKNSVKEHATALSLGYKTIAEIGRGRICLAAKQIAKERDAKMKLGNDIDLGFKAFALSRSTFKKWESDVDKIKNFEQQVLDDVDHIESDAATESILYEFLLRNGESLTTKIEKRLIAGKKVFSIEEGRLLVCLEKNLTQELIDAIASESPQQAVFLDEGFKGNDQLKVNAVHAFKTLAHEEKSETAFKTISRAK